MKIFFDLDGTLLSISKKYYLSHTLAAKIIKVKPLPFKKYWFLKRNRASEHKIIKLDLRSKLYQLYEEERIKFLESNNILAEDSLFPGVLELIKKLKKSHKLYLVTLRRNKLALKNQLNNLGIEIYFNRILSATPSKDPVGKKASLIKKIDFCLRDIVVGDTEVDILVARSLSLRSVAVYSGIRTKKFLEDYKPDFLVKYVFELSECNL